MWSGSYKLKMGDADEVGVKKAAVRESGSWLKIK